MNNASYSSVIDTISRSSVVSFIKSPDSSLNLRIPGIHELDENISHWWRNLRPDFKLSPSNIATVPRDKLPKILLINIAYHQSLCALHASIVPLFSWSASDDSWSSARQLSAQVAFEQAKLVSALIGAILSTFDSLSAIPGFIAYAAYCACAIQIPFLWCSNLVVKDLAHANIKTNVRLIRSMATYWKFAALLVKLSTFWNKISVANSVAKQQVHVRCLYNVHKRHPIILEGEPKHMDAAKLTSCKINTTYVRASILEYTGILMSPRDEFAKPGEEINNLGIEDGSGIEAPSRGSVVDQQEGKITQIWSKTKTPKKKC
jgi:hypothetical protein